jgi:hypothetical protein
MKWWRIKRADIDPSFRAMFEEQGAETVRSFLAALPGMVFTRHEDTVVTVQQVRLPMQKWLKEQYDRAERRETWLITMEVAITVFVASELILSLISFLHGNSK